MEAEDKKIRTVRIKEKDIELFNFISKFGFATSVQLAEFTGSKLDSLKIRLSHMVNDGYLINHRIFYDKPSVYTVTKKANMTDLSVIQEVNLRDYFHDLMVIDVFLKLRKHFISYESEKMIRSERGVGVGRSGRIPDLVGYLQGDLRVAIEVDRTDKSIERLKTIVASYAGNLEYDEVWFICASDFIYNNFQKIWLDSKIKLFHLGDVLAGKELKYVRTKEPQYVPFELQKSFVTEDEPEAIAEVIGQTEPESKGFGGFKF